MGKQKATPSDHSQGGETVDPRDAQIERLAGLVETQNKHIENLLAEREGLLTAAPAGGVEGQLAGVIDRMGTMMERQEGLLERMQSQPEQPRVAWNYAEGQRAPQPEGGWAGALKTTGWRDRGERPTRGQGPDELPDAEMYRVVAPAREGRAGHPRFGQLNYNGITSIVLPDDELSNKNSGPDSPTSYEGGRQVHLRFANGVALTDDKLVAWTFMKQFGYSVEIETRPVKYIGQPIPGADQVTATAEKLRVSDEVA